MECEFDSCMGQLIADGKYNCLGHKHVTCTDCKRGYYIIVKYLNDSILKYVSDNK